MRPPRTARHKAGKQSPTTTQRAIKKRRASVDGRWCASGYGLQNPVADVRRRGNAARTGRALSTGTSCALPDQLLFDQLRLEGGLLCCATDRQADFGAWARAWGDGADDFGVGGEGVPAKCVATLKHRFTEQPVVGHARPDDGGSITVRAAKKRANGSGHRHLSSRSRSWECRASTRSRQSGQVGDG